MTEPVDFEGSRPQSVSSLFAAVPEAAWPR